MWRKIIPVAALIVVGCTSQSSQLNPVATTLPRPAVISTSTPIVLPSSSFNPYDYIGKGNRYNCSAFASQAQAQAVLRADPKDPNHLDDDRDGIACEGNKPPYDKVKVSR